MVWDWVLGSRILIQNTWYGIGFFGCRVLRKIHGVGLGFGQQDSNTKHMVWDWFLWLLSYSHTLHITHYIYTAWNNTGLSLGATSNH